MQSIARSSIQSVKALLCLLVTCFLVTDGYASILDEEQQKQAEIKAAEHVAKSFEYELTGRPDPFVPFIEPQVATKLDPNEIIEDEVVLTGMQLFEPGQLKLVAVMFATDKKMAMVQDVTGKGYVINEGVLIGRHGVVSEITTDQVIVTEKTRTRAGKEIINTVVMRLNKEGDK